MSEEHFLPFIKSLKKIGYAGQVVLFVADLSGRSLSVLRDVGVEIVPVEESYRKAIGDSQLRLLNSLRNTRRIRRIYPLVFRLISDFPYLTRSESRRKYAEFMCEGLQSLRYQHYLTYLNTAGVHCDQVLLSDVRDVLFQDDPFRRPLERLALALEPVESTFSSAGYNGRWILNLYGKAMAKRLAERTPSCSGTTMGPRAAVVRYLELMIGEVARHTRPLGSHDQGIHNKLLYTGEFADADVQANGTGTILTMGGMEALAVGDDGHIYNPDGSLPAVIHQYDRHVEHARRLQILLSGSDRLQTAAQ